MVRSLATLLACLACLAVASCKNPSESSPTPPTSPVTPLASPGTAASSTPEPDSPRDDPDPVLYTYCLTEEHIVGIEARMLDKPPAQAIADLRKAQAFAYAQANALAQAGRADQAQAVRDWGRAFDQTIRMLRKGADPFDALMPATRALGKVGFLIDCEVDQ